MTPPQHDPGDSHRTRPIRITHCIGTMRIGGAEKQLAELIRRLPRERFEQSLVLVQGGGPLIESVRSAGCEVVELGYQMKFRKFDPRCYVAMASALSKFTEHLRRSRPDILHAQLYWANILSVVAGRRARVPAIVTSRLQLSNYKEGRPMLQLIENFANRYTTAIFANSEAVRRDAIEHEKIGRAEIRVIPNGVELEDFERLDASGPRNEFAIGEHHFVIVAVANLHPYKGHADLIRAAGALAKTHTNLRLILPGRDQGARADLERLVKDLGLEEAVRLIGEREDIGSLLAMADVVVHPSHEEGFSNAILEAMAARKPVVATNVGGNPEAVVDGETGYLVPPRDPDSLAEAIEKLIVDANLRRRMGEAGWRRMEQEFSMKRLVERFAEWYEELAANSVTQR